MTTPNECPMPLGEPREFIKDVAEAQEICGELLEARVPIYLAKIDGEWKITDINTEAIDITCHVDHDVEKSIADDDERRAIYVEVWDMVHEFTDSLKHHDLVDFDQVRTLQGRS